MSNTSGVQRSGGATGSPFDERFDNTRGYTPPPNGQKRNSMDSVAQYQPVTPTVQQETRRPMLPTSVVAAYATGPPIQRVPSHPTLSEHGLQRHSNAIIPGPPGHSYGQFKSQEDHQNRPSEQTYRDGPQLNFKYDSTTQDLNHSRVQHHARPYLVPHQQQAHQEQPQQNQQTIPSAPQRPPPSAASSPIAPQPPNPVSIRKPNTSQAAPIHPDAIKAAAKALTPIQHLYEEAWVRTVASVQHEISRMHGELTRLLDAERRQSQMMRVERDAVFEEANRLRAENAEVREDIKRAAAEVQRVRLDRDEQAVEFRRLQANNEVLHRQGQAQMLRVQAGEQAQKDAIHSTVETIRAELAKQFEVDMAVKVREVQEQRSLRALAEKRLAEATQKLKGITDGLLSASQFCSEQQRQASEPATLIGTPEIELTKFKVEREENPDRTHSPIARGERVFGSRPPSRATSNSPLVQTSLPHVKQEPLSTRQSTPSSHSPRISPRVQSPRPSTSASRSPHSLYLHVSNTLREHHENHDSSDHAPAPCPTPSSDNRLRDKGPDECPTLSVAPRSETNQQQPRLLTAVPPVQSPSQSEYRPLSNRTDSQHSPALEAPGNRSASLQHNQSSPPRHQFPPRPDYHKPTPLAGPSNQRYRPTTNHAPSSPPRSAATTPPIVARFTVPLSPSQGSPDLRKRKRGRTEFEHEGSARWTSEHRRLAPARSLTDPSDNRERSRPRPRLDEPRICAQAETLPEVVSASMEQSSSTTLTTSSSSSTAGTRPLEEGELLTTPKLDTGEALPTLVAVDVKPQIDKATRPRPNKIGINHMDLLYETRGDNMICRMCRSRPKDADKQTPPMTFSTKATWPELVGHCKTGHPKDWEELERLSPSQIGELRQRMTSSSSAGFMLR